GLDSKAHSGFYRFISCTYIMHIQSEMMPYTVIKIFFVCRIIGVLIFYILSGKQPDFKQLFFHFKVYLFYVCSIINARLQHRLTEIMHIKTSVIYLSLAFCKLTVYGNSARKVGVV